MALGDIVDLPDSGCGDFPKGTGTDRFITLHGDE
jgi:hypothetical protein